MKLVKNQYESSDGLKFRQEFHRRYSQNKIGIANWAFDYYQLRPGMKVLELGAGLGRIWAQKAAQLPAEIEIVLSDLTETMVAQATNNTQDVKQVRVKRIDAQQIPYPENTFDIVIANHMLYHVPDLPQAIAEIYRVLKPGGTFYATTLSMKGMQGYLHEKLRQYNPNWDFFGPENYAFSMQTGERVLRGKFPVVKKEFYPDKLRINRVEDLVDWMYSGVHFAQVSTTEREKLIDFF